MIKKTLLKNDDYSLTVSVSRTIPSDLYEVKFIQQYELDERMNTCDRFFLTKESLATLKEALNVEELYNPKCDVCGFINNMEKEPPVIICSSCGNMLKK